VIGIEFAYDTTQKSEGLGFVESLKKSAITTYAYSVQIMMAIKMLFTKRTLKGAGGPVMIISESVKLAQKGFIFLLTFLAIISINLAIINLLPLPIFDGGQLLFTTIESLIGRELPVNIKNVIHMASWLMILGLILYLTFNDIWYIVTGKLR